MSTAVPDRPTTGLTRAQMIAARQKRSLVWRIIHLLGSLQLALVLIGTIAIACAVATFTESGFNTKIAQAYIYKAPWFQVWLAVLCVNLLAVTITRWPWQKKHIGFVITHYGIITLLTGAVIGLRTGYEGNVTLRLNAPPINWVTTSRSIIRMENPLDGAIYTLPFDAETAKLSPDHPHDFPVPATPLKVVADQYSPNLIDHRELVAAPGAGPGVALEMTSNMMGQHVDLPLVLTGGQPDSEDFFGLARITLRAALPELPAELRESQLVFAKYAPVVTGPVASGFQIHLSTDGKDVVITDPHGDEKSFVRSETAGKDVPLFGATFSFQQYWPDFYMNGGAPATRSDAPNNPALLVQISFPPASDEKKPSLELAPTREGVAYRLSRQGRPYASGIAKEGDVFPLGWADWTARVQKILPEASITSEIVSGPPLEKNMQGVPGFQARLVSDSGASGPARWIESGKMTSLSEGPYSVRFGYGLENRPLPFNLRLVSFEVPRDEGTDTPSDFRATVEFNDPQTGATKTGVARMNHPASFPGTFWANVTGFNYKFSQAEWNPRDLDETTLQVLYDPGWLFKWMGSLGIVIGIAIMFYWKPSR